MLDLRPILFVNGLLLVMLGAGMAAPAAVDLAFGNPDWRVFLAAAALTVFVGGNLMLAYRTGSDRLDLKQAFLMTTAAWTLIPAFAALPFVFSELSLSYTDAYFEAMSGITTTGSTVIVSLDQAPPGLLLWRAVLQWLGGIGIVVMAVSVLPMLQIGGMQLFKIEAYGTPDKILPRAAQIAGAITILYLSLTVLCVAALWAAGMSAFDAVAHAMTTIATGGYSTYDASVGYFDSALIEAIITGFMLIASMPFVLHLYALRGRPLILLRDAQVRFFLGLVALLIAATMLWLVIFKGFAADAALRYASFNIVSVLTGTGYASTDYNAWGAFSTTLFFFVMFIGGCAGSTSCGIKIFRFQVMFSALAKVLRQVLRPHGVFIAAFNGKPIPESALASVLGFFVLFLVSFIGLAVALAATGLDAETALSGAGTALANVGPGLGGTIGPAGNFKPLPDSAKWLLSGGMLLGRLELFTVLVLLTPRFWRA
ncbi:MAG: TrkH family potassium uptake protein [Pseudomonadota bacterium]